MSDDAAIRLSNLKSLGLAVPELKGRLGRTPSFWSDLLNGHKSFGEKLARSLEEGLELPRGWLDAAHDAGAPAPPIRKPSSGSVTVYVESVVEAIAIRLDTMADESRERTVAALITLARAPDSQRARAAAIAALQVGGDTVDVKLASGTAFSAYALDLAKTLDAMPESERARAHAAASVALSIRQIEATAQNSATPPQAPPPAKRPGQAPRKSR